MRLKPTLLLAVLAATPALSACADNWLNIEGAPLRNELGWTEERALRSTWLTPRVVLPEPAYCYRTLAQADCYLRPQPREAERLVGYIGPELF